MVNTESPKKLVSISEARDILSKLDPEQADQIQKRTIDYASKFSKASEDKTIEARQRLMAECELTEAEAIESINVLPKTIAELRVFTSGWKKLLPTDKMEKILGILRKLE
tara:strand:- start:109 stop:438 length:330 start_codon:yes stop_codon:yes gene_type:complete